MSGAVTRFDRAGKPIAEPCSHGVVGICIDDMTPEARDAYWFAHSHAYDYVAEPDGDRDNAERYAAWVVGRYFVDSLNDMPDHSAAYQRYLREAE